MPAPLKEILMRLALGSIAVAALIVGCATMAPSRNEAVAELAPTAGNNAKGTVTFSQKDDTVLVVAKLSGLTPGSHGFHVHEKAIAARRMR
jgi:Cu-Zn family superoxide dismutase